VKPASIAIKDMPVQRLNNFEKNNMMASLKLIRTPVFFADKEPQ